MSQTSSPSGVPIAAGDADEVLKLRCPVCTTGLNLRRKHLGIQGACVKCETKVVAKEVGGTVVLVQADEREPIVEPEVPTAPVEEPAPVDASSEPEPEVPSAFSDLAPLKMSDSGMVEWPAPEVSAEPEPKKEEEPSAFASSLDEAALPAWGAPVDAAPAAPATSESAAGEPATRSETTESKWGFPGREEDGKSAVASIPGPPTESETIAASFDLPEVESIESSFPGFGSPEGGSLFGSADASAEAPPAAEESILGSEKAEEGSPQASAFTDSASPFDDDFGMTKSSSLFASSTPKEAPAAEDSSDSANESGVNSGWGTKVPLQNHASISPFSTGSADEEPGFAESLFRDKAVEKSDYEPKSPFGENEGAPKTGGALFANSGQKQEQASAQKEEVVLDGDGRPLRPMSDEEKEQFAEDMMKYGGYHKKSPWVKRIRRVVVTLVLLVGIGYGTYVFLPREMAASWKNKTLDWLEPGFSALDFLPVEIVEVEGGEPGEKEFKVKAVEQLNEFSGKFDAYLDQADQNLRDSGAAMPDEREKAPLPDMPEIPKLPFKLPGGMKLDIPGQEGDAASAPAEEAAGE